MTSETSDATQLVHIGRQAVYDRAGEVFGYELLFRGSADATEASKRSMHATSNVIVNAFTEFGLDQLVGTKLCFINLTRDFLTGDLPLPFPPGMAVLEVLEDVEIDDEVVAGITALADQGYQIALDDFVWGLGHELLLDLVQYVKIDVKSTPAPVIATTLFQVRRHPRIKLVAERVENDQLLDLAHKFGFELFQGHAMGRPQTMSAVSLSPSRVRRLELFGALTAPDIEFNQVVQIVTTDPALSYRVLQATNSAATGLPRKVSSVRDAIMLLGTDRIRQWVALMLVSDIAEATDEQLSSMMSRAKLCQTVAERLGVATDAAFTVGLLAGVAELIAVPMDELVSKLPVTPEIVDALVDGKGRLGEVLSMVRAYEDTDMAALHSGPVTSSELARAYLQAVGWSVKTLDGVSSGRAARRLPPPSALKKQA